MSKDKRCLVCFLLLLLAGCSERERGIPIYIKNNLGEIIYHTTDYISCNFIVYTLPTGAYKKIKMEIAKDGLWKTTPVAQSILDGTSVNTKTLFGGMQCGSRSNEYKNIFMEEIEKNTGDYIFWGNIFILILKDKNILFMASYS